MLLGGPEQIGLGGQYIQVWEGLSLTLERGQDGCIREVLQGVATQVCMHVYNKFMNPLIHCKLKNVIVMYRIQN